jgi:glycosyltransferase involved in cell wall biosynthesis
MWESEFRGPFQSALREVHARRDQAPRRPTVSVVVPTLNEAENLPLLFSQLPDEVSEVVIVDGHSTDGTVDVARSLDPDVTIVLEDRPGKGNALTRGFAVARGDIIVALDADNSADPSEIERFVSALSDGADYAKGSRFVDGGGSSDITWLRWLGNRALTAVTNLVHGTSYTDLCYGYNAFWKRRLDDIMPNAEGFEVETAMNIRAAKAGLTVVEVPSFERDRAFGESHLHAFRDGWRALRTIVGEATPDMGHR